MMKDIHRRQVFNAIYKEKQISRLQIADKLQLSLPTVTQNIKSLEEAGLIERDGFFQSTGGRKSYIYTCVKQAGIAIGAHITQRSIRLVAVDLYGNIFARHQIEAVYSHDRAFYRLFGECIREFVDSLDVNPDKILGVGIALMALLSKDRKSVRTSLLLGTNQAQLSDFKEWIDYPCQLVHDSEAAAGAELWFSPDISDALYLGMNYYCNGALIMNNKIHTGKENNGGLVEHLTIYPDGNPCYCGKRGCLSTYCSGHVLFKDNEASREEFFCRLRANEPAQVRKWKEFMKNLSIAIGSLTAVLDCDIILGGVIGNYMEESDVLLLQEMVRHNSHYAPSTDFIRLGHKDIDISACGASISYISEFLENI